MVRADEGESEAAVSMHGGYEASRLPSWFPELRWFDTVHRKRGSLVQAIAGFQSSNHGMSVTGMHFQVGYHDSRHL